MSACKQVWDSFSRHGDGKQEAKARGFLRTWKDKQIWMTTIMGDVLEIYKVLQKQFQRDDLILCDVLTCRHSTLRKFHGKLPLSGKV